MKIYLAGGNGKLEIMKLFLAGAVSGNLKPAWKRVAESNDISSRSWIKSLQDENF